MSWRRERLSRAPLLGIARFLAWVAATVWIAVGLSVGDLAARQSGDGDGPVFVGDDGVMRWTGSGEEVALFGVNYTAPFAYAYRAIGRVGADRKAAIDADVAHFARLGLDAFRVHVWDREVSDREGNLVENEHLDLLDYLVARLAEHGIRTILTPIAWWGTGYPERDPPTEGLSDGWDKGGMTTDPVARLAEARYVAQFVAHVNPYTGRSYGDDPSVLAVEVFNEPSHPGGPAETTAFIDAMVRALRETGFRKPIFYNISQGYTDEHGNAVCAADIQGVSHQWYPTGLVRNGAVGGNMLPNVDRYPIPYADFPGCRDKARMVYEFDAADEAGSFMYPAMARAFRGAGFQWATQFAYDPLAIAWSNTEYQTHFLNLVYTPHKAISFMIAGTAFRTLPRGGSYGVYPASERFASFRVSYEEDLSEMVEDTVFLYSNDTDTRPPAPGALRHVAGAGSSPVVRYDGTGAYFLDRVADGVWRLEAYPDAVQVVDPFTRPSLEREAVRVLWRTRRMTVDLPDLGADFTARRADGGNDHRPAVQGRTLEVRPGVYLLARAGVEASPSAAGEVAGRRLGAFVAPPPSAATRTVVLHTPTAEATAAEPLRVTVRVVGAEPPDSVALFARHVGGFGRMLRLPMVPTGGFGYVADVPSDAVRLGLLEYVVAVYTPDGTRSFPGADAGDPSHWDYTGREAWRVPVVDAGSPILLYDAGRDLDGLLMPNPFAYVRFRTDVVPGSAPGRSAFRVDVQDFVPMPHHFAVRTFLGVPERSRLAEADAEWGLRVRMRSTGRTAERVQVALVERDGTAWGATIDVTDVWRDVAVPLSTLRRVPLALLPRPYPEFLPYLLTADTDHAAPDPLRLDGIQLLVSPDLVEGGSPGAHGFEVESVILERTSGGP